jgi:predicted transcriptional regulator
MILFLQFKKILYRYSENRFLENLKTSKINIKNFPFDLILRKKDVALVVPILKNVQSFKKFHRRAFLK